MTRTSKKICDYAGTYCACVGYVRRNDERPGWPKALCTCGHPFSQHHERHEGYNVNETAAKYVPLTWPH